MQNACWSKTDADRRRILAPTDGVQDEKRRHRGKEGSSKASSCSKNRRRREILPLTVHR